MKPKVKGINLLPKEYIQAQKLKIYLLLAAVLVIIECTVFVYTVVLPPLNKIEEQNAAITTLELQVGDAKYAEVNQAIDNLETAKADIQKWIDKYGHIKKPNFISAELFDEVLSRVPQGFKIESLQITPGQNASEESRIALKGKTTSNQAVYNYITVLETTYKGCKISWNVGEPDTESIYQTYDIAISIPGSQLAAEAVTEAAAEPVVESIPEGGVQ